MLKPSNLANGQEQHEAFKTATMKKAVSSTTTDIPMESCSPA